MSETLRRCWMLILALLVVGLGWPRLAMAEQVVRVELVDLSGEQLMRARAQSTWLGEHRDAMLLDDGLGPDKSAGDGIWTAEWRGESLRMMPLTVHAQCQSADWQEIYAGLQRLEQGETVVGLVVGDNCELPAIRVARPEATALELDRERLLAHMSWILGVMVFVVWLVARHRPVPQSSGKPHGLGRWLVVWLVLAALWTYPAILAGPGGWVGRHFDLPGTIWSISALPRMGAGLFDPATGWPRGVSYSQLDSYTLIPLSWLSEWIHPARLHGWLQVLGVALSAWAAQAFAREVGARSPWDAVAGLSFAFSGIASHALLEGHVYHVLNPWMPLFALFWWRAMSAQGRVKDGAIAGILFCLTLLTTAYLGVAAAVIASGFFVGGLWRQGQRVLAPAMAAWIPILPVALGYTWLMGSGDPVVHSNSMESIQLGSANMLNLLAPVPEIDLERHSLAPALSPVALALLFAAPLVIGRRAGVSVLMWTAIAGLVMSLGPSINADGNSSLLSTPMYWLLDSVNLQFLRFPVRFIWVWELCAGAVAALVLTQLSRTRRWGAVLLLVAALGHAFVGVGHPLRQGVQVGAVPSAYSHAEGPVLDLFPRGSDLAGEEELWFSGLACGYQAVHQLAIAENCVATSQEKNPRGVLSSLVIPQLLAGEVWPTALLLSSLGFDAVALHVDMFSASDAARLSSSLKVMEGEVVVSTDGGEHVALFRLPESLQGERVTHEEAIQTFEALQYMGAARAPVIGIPGGDASDGGATKALFVEVHEELEEVGTIDSWLATLTWPNGTQDLQFADPLVSIRGDDELLEMRWLASWKGAIPSTFNLTLRGLGPTGEQRTTWTGDVYLSGAIERISFGYSARGVQPETSTRSHEMPHGRLESGLLASFFWGVFILLVTVWRRVARPVVMEGSGIAESGDNTDS